MISAAHDSYFILILKYIDTNCFETSMIISCKKQAVCTICVLSLARLKFFM